MSWPSGVRMQARYFPPTRRSIFAAGDVKSFGPHQRMKCSGSVHAFQTSSGGASKMRVISTSTVPGLLLVVILFLLRTFTAIVLLLLLLLLLLLPLQFLEIVIEAVEALLPEAAVLFDVVRDVLQGAG